MACKGVHMVAARHLPDVLTETCPRRCGASGRGRRLTWTFVSAGYASMLCSTVKWRARRSRIIGVWHGRGGAVDGSAASQACPRPALK